MLTCAPTFNDSLMSCFFYWQFNVMTLTMKGIGGESECVSIAASKLLTTCPLPLQRPQPISMGRFIQSRLKKLSILLPVLSMPQRDNFLLFYFVFTSSRSPGTFVEYLEVVAVYATSATVPPVVEDCHQDHLYHWLSLKRTHFMRCWDHIGINGKVALIVKDYSWVTVMTLATRPFKMFLCPLPPDFWLKVPPKRA